MSHFTVLVVGDNPEEQLAPYDENIQMSEYKVGPISEEGLNRFRNYYIKDHPDEASLSIEELYKLHGEDWNGNGWKYEDGIFVEYSTYNPKSKWDWYQIGGRWSGFFKVKPNGVGVLGEKGLMGSCAHDGEGYADQIMKRNIDFEGMYKEKAEKFGKDYDDVLAIVGSHLSTFVSWPKMRERYAGDIDKAREEYHRQPAIMALNEHREYAFTDLEDYQVSRDEYITSNSQLSTFAVVKDGEWYERGKMGWWACVSDEKSDQEWKAEFKKLLDDLPEDILLTVVDCHI